MKRSDIPGEHVPRPCCFDCLSGNVTVRVTDDMGFEHWFCAEDWAAHEALRDRIADLLDAAWDALSE